ncbi:predicted protein [Streptomyces lividans TK24]|nr:predicted protein [Streptomyces lividans TK24]
MAVRDVPRPFIERGGAHLTPCMYGTSGDWAYVLERSRMTARWQRHRKSIAQRFVLGVTGGTGSGCVTLLVLYVQHGV